MAFADLPKNREGPSRRFLRSHIFDRVCIEQGIDTVDQALIIHGPTARQSEWNRRIKDATVEVFHYEDLESLKAHVLTFVRHLKALRWRTPY